MGFDRSSSDPYVFISYAREDAAIADGLARALDAADPPIPWWMDRYAIKTGEGYPTAISQGVAGATLVAILFSDKSAFKQGVLDEYLLAQQTGKQFARILLSPLDEVVHHEPDGAPRTMKESPLFAGTDATEQLIVGRTGRNPADSDFELFARLLGEALYGAAHVSDKLDALAPRRGASVTTAEIEAVCSLGHMAIAPVVQRMELVLHEQALALDQQTGGAERSSIEAYEYLSNLGSALAGLLRRLFSLRETVGDGLGIHPEDLDTARISRLLVGLLEYMHEEGYQTVPLSFFEVMVLLGREEATRIVSSAIAASSKRGDPIAPSSLAFLSAMGHKEATPYAIEMISQSGWTPAHRQEVLQLFWRFGAEETLVALNQVLATPPVKLSKKVAGEISETAEYLRSLLDEAAMLQGAPHTIWTIQREGQLRAQYNGISPTRHDVELALLLFDAGHLVLTTQNWGPRPPRTFAELRRSRNHYLPYRSVGGTEYQLPPKEVWRLTKLLLTGQASEFGLYGGDPVNNPLRKLGFEIRSFDKSANPSSPTED